MEMKMEPVKNEEYVGRVSEQISPLQSLLTQIEQELFALKANDTCENNSKLMISAINLSGMVEALLANLNTIGDNHHMKHHEEKGSPEGEPTEEEIHAFLETLFGVRRRGRTH